MNHSYNSLTQRKPKNQDKITKKYLFVSKNGLTIEKYDAKIKTSQILGQKEGENLVRYNELIAERVRAGMSQKDAAKVCGCSVNTYCRKETGKSSFTVDEVTKLCHALGIVDAERKAFIFLV